MKRGKEEEEGDIVEYQPPSIKAPCLSSIKEKSEVNIKISETATLESRNIKQITEKTAYIIRATGRNEGGHEDSSGKLEKVLGRGDKYEKWLGKDVK